jgi:hypothetical protein
VVLGVATVDGPFAAGLTVAANDCAGMVLEPRETCAVTVRYAPVTGGTAAGHLDLTTDDGPLDVPVIATAPSVSALVSPELPHPQFVPIAGGATGVGDPQRWRLMLTNPLSARIATSRVTLSGGDARRFHFTLDGCAHTTLRPHGGCRLTLVFTPHRAGTAHAQLTVTGTGLPLIAQLRPVASRAPRGRPRGLAIIQRTSVHPGESS